MVIQSYKEWAVPMRSLLERDGPRLRVRESLRHYGRGVMSVSFADRSRLPVDIYFTNSADDGAITGAFLMERGEQYSRMICEVLNAGFTTGYPEFEAVTLGVPVMPCPVSIAMAKLTFEDAMWKVWVVHNIFVNRVDTSELIAKVGLELTSIYYSIARLQDYLDI